MQRTAELGTPDSQVAAAEQRSWRQALTRYRASSAWPAAAQLGNTLLPLAALFWLMHLSLAYPYALTLVLALPTAGFLVRTFIIVHDCAHCSFVRSRRANELIGILASVLTVTPFTHWRREHALHHAGSGDLERRGHGDFSTLTAEEYLSRTRWGRLQYRLSRSPVVLFGIGPVHVLVTRCWQLLRSATDRRQGARAQAIDGAILAAIVLLSWLIGLETLLLVYFPAFFLAAAVGIWLTHVQHQFEDAYWQPHGEWDFMEAALRGSSYFRLPRVLEWLTGSIGLHHVHHMDPKIPNYNLRRCHEENAEFHAAPQVTLRGSLRTLSLRVWDAERGRLVGFDALKRRRTSGAAGAPFETSA